jgi:hypothetical protein
MQTRTIFGCGPGGAITLTTRRLASAPTVNEPAQERSMPQHIPDGWTGFDFTLTPDAKDAFESAAASLQCVKYTPIAFATQEVAGTHYSFLCEAEPQAQGAAISLVKMRIFRPLECRDTPIEVKPIIVSIETITP